MKKCYEYEDYSVIIGDIIDSKKIKDRKHIQNHFKKALDNINENYSESIGSKFTITLGDEFQGLLKDRENIVDIISEIERIMFPITLRFGIGIGDITTEINYESSSVIDGSSYHRARAMIEELEESDSQYAKREANILLASADTNSELDQLINAIFSLATVLKSQWTVRQQEIINAYLLNDENQYKTAESLGIGQSSVSKALKAANFTSYQLAMKDVRSFLSGKGEK